MSNESCSRSSPNTTTALLIVSRRLSESKNQLDGVAQDKLPCRYRESMRRLRFLLNACRESPEMIVFEFLKNARNEVSTSLVTPSRNGPNDRPIPLFLHASTKKKKTRQCIKLFARAVVLPQNLFPPSLNELVGTKLKAAVASPVRQSKNKSCQERAALCFSCKFWSPFEFHCRAYYYVARPFRSSQRRAYAFFK